MLNFYDFEVFKEDWLVVIINIYEKSEVVIINDKEKLQEYYDAHKNQIWVGYNNNHYDQYILKAIFVDSILRKSTISLSLKENMDGNSAAYSENSKCTITT